MPAWELLCSHAIPSCDTRALRRYGFRTALLATRDTLPVCCSKGLNRQPVKLVQASVVILSSSDDEEVLGGQREVLADVGKLQSFVFGSRAVGIIGQHTRFLVVDEVIVLIFGLVADFEELAR